GELGGAGDGDGGDRAGDEFGGAAGACDRGDPERAHGVAPSGVEGGRGEVRVGVRGPPIPEVLIRLRAPTFPAVTIVVSCSTKESPPKLSAANTSDSPNHSHI